MRSQLCALVAALLSGFVSGCEDHDWTSPMLGQGHIDHELMRRHDFTKRIQPGALPTLPQQIKDIHWGQLNIISTTDTHGWLAGHLLDENYSADYGDFADFVRKMKAKADVLGVDLLLVDSGDLHDGTGFSDATTPQGRFTLPIFNQLPYDLLSIGNHELYTTEIANDTYRNFAPKWGGRYVTSNVDFIDNGIRKPFSNRYAYYQTKFGLRVLSMAFLYNFTGNSNASVVTPVGTAIQQSWFKEQASRQDVDLFLIAGHITLRGSTEWDLIYSAIRRYHPTTPILIFGGHRHIRDAVSWDASAVGTAAGRYCETAGWTTIDGLGNATRAKSPMGSGTIKNPKASAVAGLNFTQVTSSNFSYTRQYLDFNRPTFERHTASLNQGFNASYGAGITNQITTNFSSLTSLTTLLGCAPESYYQSRYPQSSPNNLYTWLTTTVFPAVVYAPGRNTSAYPRIIMTNTGGFRYDVLQGRFTLDNAYQTNPYTNGWYYMGSTYGVAKNLLANMQTDKVYKRQTMNETTYNSTTGLYETPGYLTKDDFGTDGDNTIHYDQGSYDVGHYVAANVSVSNISDSTPVDVYATSYFTAAAAKYLTGNTTDWIAVTNSTGGVFTSFATVPLYAQLFWSKDC